MPWRSSELPIGPKIRQLLDHVGTEEKASLRLGAHETPEWFFHLGAGDSI
jgi:hypothetical protein